MQFDIVTLFPDFFHSFFRTSMMGRAVKNGCIGYKLANPRVFGKGKYRSVDDYLYGGSKGMLLRRDVLKKTLHALSHSHSSLTSQRILLSPRGRTLSQNLVAHFKSFQSICLICGHYEGVDTRFEQDIDEVISIGDYVLFGGEVAAMVFMEVVSRHIPGVLKGHFISENESYVDGLLEEDQYTRPFTEDVPQVLRGGNHLEIQKWKYKNRLINTYEKRIDLIKKRDPDIFELDILLEYLLKKHSLQPANSKAMIE